MRFPETVTPGMSTLLRVATCVRHSVCHPVRHPVSPCARRSRHSYSSIMIIIACQCWLVPVPVDIVPFLVSLFPLTGEMGAMRARRRPLPVITSCGGGLILVRTTPLVVRPSLHVLDRSTVICVCPDGSPALKQALFLWMPIPRGASTTYTTP